MAQDEASNSDDVLLMVTTNLELGN